MKSSRRPLAVARKKQIAAIGNFILFMRTLLVNLLDHVAIFATPSPTVASVKTDVDDLEAAEAVAKTRAQGAAAARDLQYDKVMDDLNNLLLYVQTLADNAVDEPTAISIIEASGFGLKNKGVRVKAPLAVKQISDNMLKLMAKAAAKRATYFWEQSEDGNAWTALPATLKATTVVEGVGAGQRLLFRVRSLTKKDGLSNWSVVVSIIVT